MEAKPPLFITNAIPYVNAVPHVGYTVELIMTDTLARYARRSREVYALNGTDENALKNVLAAEKAGVPVADFVEEHSRAFRDLSPLLNLSFDQFVRTSEPPHFEGAQKLWARIAERSPEAIYKRSYEGFYCVGCEEFKTEKDLVEGLCSEHQKAPERIREENYFFRLSAYQDRLLALIEEGKLSINPEFRKNEVLSFIRMGLEDFSVSRSHERARGWGVPVPGDESQIMYVWVDALSNYISALDFAHEGELYRKYWAGDGERAHVIGKGILRFHAIYWPAMLMAADLPLPTAIYSHEYLTVDGQKMSKTLGNVINPTELVGKYGTDGTRYLLLSMLPHTKDGDISWEKMTEKYNADLANGLGNLFSRVMKLSESLDHLPPLGVLSPASVEKFFQHGDLFAALGALAQQVRDLNKYMDDEKPWILVKQDQERFTAVMHRLLTRLAELARDYEPFMPETANKMKTALAEGKTEPLFQRL